MKETTKIYKYGDAYVGEDMHMEIERMMDQELKRASEMSSEEFTKFLDELDKDEE